MAPKNKTTQTEDAAPTPPTTPEPETAMTAPPPAGPTSLATTLADEYGEDAGKGHENWTADLQMVPFINILQANSPILATSEDPLARPGNFWDALTGVFWSGKAGLEVIPITYKRELLEWVPRPKDGEPKTAAPAGNGYRGRHEVKTFEKLMKLAQAKGVFGKYTHPENGNNLVDTYTTFYLVKFPDGSWQTRCIGHKGTHVKPFKKYLNVCNTLLVTTPQGKKPLPAFAHSGRITTYPFSDGTNNWIKITIEPAAPSRAVIDSLVPKLDPRYIEARDMAEFINTGVVEADHATQASEGATTEGGTKADPENDDPY